jgi:hypothetical protein
MRRYTWITPNGGKITTKTIREFADLTGMRYSNATSLACGHYLTLHGYCSMHRKAKKKRKRMLTELLNTRTGQRKCLGRSVKTFAADHGICTSELHKLICGRKIAIRDWMLASTADLLAHATVADSSS